MTSLTLKQAIDKGRLDEFIRQEEARGLPSAEIAKLDGAIAKLIKAPRSARRTSRSRSAGGSRGK